MRPRGLEDRKAVPEVAGIAVKWFLEYQSWSLGRRVGVQRGGKCTVVTKTQIVKLDVTNLSFTSLGVSTYDHHWWLRPLSPIVRMVW